jgi:hypothetical protein
MNVVSWENGDTTITDLPDCADPMLALIVQRVNDKICRHRDGGLLCPECSIAVLDLAHRTVGTGHLFDDELEQQRVWVRVAARLARDIAHPSRDPRVMAAIEAAERWAAHPSAASTHTVYVAHAAVSAYAATACTAVYAAYAAVYAVYAAVYAAHAAVYAAHAAYDSVDAAAHAALTAAYVDRDELLTVAHRAIDLFNEYTGHVDTPPDPVVVERAVENMLNIS